LSHKTNAVSEPSALHLSCTWPYRTSAGQMPRPSPRPAEKRRGTFFFRGRNIIPPLPASRKAVMCTETQKPESCPGSCHPAGSDTLLFAGIGRPMKSRQEIPWLCFGEVFGELEVAIPGGQFNSGCEIGPDGDFIVGFPDGFRFILSLMQVHPPLPAKADAGPIHPNRPPLQVRSGRRFARAGPIPGRERAPRQHRGFAGRGE